MIVTLLIQIAGNCGCVYSLRDFNRKRKKEGREIIKLGVKFYGR